MRARPSRPVAVVAAIAAALWALFLLPPQQQAWSGVYAPRWLRVLDDLPVYHAIRGWLHSVGEHDFYLAFGASAALSFVLIWWATGPAFAALGWSGRALGWLTLLGAPVTALSYLNHAADAPLHLLWGAEAYALMLVGAWAIVAAVVAPRGRGIPGWERALLAATLPILVVSTLAFSYWPHGTLIGFGMEAAVLGAFAPRWEPPLTPSPTPSADVPAAMAAQNDISRRERSTLAEGDAGD